MRFETIKSIEPAGEEETFDLMVSRNHNFVANGFIVHNSGWGKGLATETIAEEFQRAGYVVIYLADPKNAIEAGFAQFEPEERYHLDALRREGKRPEKKKVKLYHPFTFRIPRIDLPDYNFYTFSLKDMGRKEWSMIAESNWDTDTIKLLLSASQNIPKDDDLYSFLHYVQDRTRGKKQSKNFKPDPHNFHLSIAGGTVKSIQDISAFLQPFLTDYFLASDDCPLKLDFKKILADQEHYHVFASNFIKDDKLREFAILMLFNKILENKEHAKHPLLIVIPEIRYLVPFKPEGYKMFLAQGIKDNLSMMRSMGRGMTALMDTQVFSGVDEEVTNSATVTLLGELGGVRDIDKVCKSMNYKREIREKLSRMDAPNSYIMKGFEKMDAIRIWFPSHMHCEPDYNFFEMFRKHCPQRLTRFTDLIQKMRDRLDKDEERIKDKVKKAQQRERELEEAKLRAKEEGKEGKAAKKADEKIEKARQIEAKSRGELMRLVYEDHQKTPLKSWRQLGREFGIDAATAKRYCQVIEQQTAAQKAKDDAQSYEDKALAQLSAPSPTQQIGPTDTT